ncbi:uncharacterized protein LOC129611039 [Condylostylus longicornis]|uniref:uncharacterized protein LOC129611039 n=1 Tax=Condylostylus longicornis TaxID=2530218 RepID=UPI00244E0EE1|nr:uncharacterized protein LOC129611039 [Condylostylus longicornis]
MQNLHISLIILVISNLSCNSAVKLKTCNTHSLKGCPPHSICEEINETTSECKCEPNYDLNSKYKNDSEYCIFNNRTANTRTKLTQATITQRVVLVSSKVSTPVSLPARSIPETDHHIVGGILIPLFIVLLVIGAAYGLKRLEIIRRIREFQMRRRRQRPFYEDVMMSHENDEPPLI